MANEILRRIFADMPIERKEEVLVGLPDSSDVLRRILVDMHTEEMFEMLKNVPVEKQRQLLKMLQQMLAEEMAPSSELQDEKK